MIKIFYPFLIIGILFCSGPLLAQQDAQFSQYMFNGIYYNPAFAGVEGVTQFTGVFRSQWTGYEPTLGGGGAPTTQLFTLNTPILRLRSGFGFHAVNDQLGALSNQQIQVSYAYHLGLPNSKLSFGIRSGIFSKAIDFNKYRWNDPNDINNLDSRVSDIKPDLAVGMFYRAEKLYAGVSYNHIIKAEFDFGSDALRNPLVSHMYLTAGYDYEYNYNLIITPSVLIKTDLNTYSIEGGVMGTYNNKMWGGLNYRDGDSFIAILGYALLKDNSLKAGYAFDLVVRAQEAKRPTSHEFLMSYTLPVVSAGGKKIVRTPRFRH
ncbi:MAG: type IX secretion system membrane protein PorP/SprF [Bacteroidota bacterium]|nr:type IX secretion system membrane protein PorP/SprF [Bacteroidota bacterium]